MGVAHVLELETDAVLLPETLFESDDTDDRVKFTDELLAEFETDGLEAEELDTDEVKVEELETEDLETVATWAASAS